MPPDPLTVLHMGDASVRKFAGSAPERTILYTVDLIGNLFMMNFVYTLCTSTPGQIQYGRFIRALARKIGDMILDQARTHPTCLQIIINTTIKIHFKFITVY